MMPLPSSRSRLTWGMKRHRDVNGPIPILRPVLAESAILFPLG